MPTPRMLLILSENWTLASGRDLPALVRWAREAEDAGFDAVMISEHVVLGPDAGARGVMGNPRAYALPGNQDPYTPWPNSLLLLSAIAAATSRIRLVAGAVLAPLRHPLLLARELGTLDLLSEGRLVVQPTVSWSRDEYTALGVPFERRGRILDEQLEILDLLWRASPVSFHGEFFDFEDVYLEPKAYRPDGPRLWFGGERLHGRLLERLVRYGGGFHPLGEPSAADMSTLHAGLEAAGRSVDELELVGGTRAVFPDEHSCADVGAAMADIPAQIERGFTTFCVKPSQFTDDPDGVGALCREVMRRAAALTR
ncbi:TIGR03619 family F420-dependent LLM class oxidoreductase [Actinospica durhamensis]|uniref:TIGR03619 family F420-dependent LLM class oxidoreductase n=1 Tax=Actinospica durhamensis TaxID=1508375 RepID=A0A941ISN7_9ACTN|nr:TIGR03619 family F420-dependent LLM class oxidoreductase [Actinospica durhamensis]MBR7838724.1 TIGR03619 family F420-dependent LLM class oxidoreductase [Actinospica durhamensis]